MSEAEWFATDQDLPATAEDIERELHDGWLDFSSIAHVGDSVTIAGYREQPIPGRWFRVGRFPVALSFVGVSRIDVHDPDGLGGIGVGDVKAEGGSMTLTSCFSGHLEVVGEELAATLKLSGVPSLERRWFRRRWEPSTR